MTLAVHRHALPLVATGCGPAGNPPGATTPPVGPRTSVAHGNLSPRLYTTAGLRVRVSGRRGSFQVKHEPQIAATGAPTVRVCGTGKSTRPTLPGGTRPTLSSLPASHAPGLFAVSRPRTSRRRNQYAPARNRQLFQRVNGNGNSRRHRVPAHIQHDWASLFVQLQTVETDTSSSCRTGLVRRK